MRDRKDTNEIYNELKKDLKEFGKKENIKFSITRKDYNYFSVAIVETKQSINKANKNVDFSYWSIYDKTYNQYLEHNEREQERIKESGLGEEFLKSFHDKELTKYGFETVKKVLDIMLKNYWDESDSQVDYFNSAFYYNLSLGKYDKDNVINEKQVEKDYYYRDYEIVKNGVKQVTRKSFI